MRERGPWQGMLTIAQFNWPFYVVAVAVMIASLAGCFLLAGALGRLVCGLALAGSAYSMRNR